MLSRSHMLASALQVGLPSTAAEGFMTTVVQAHAAVHARMRAIARQRRQQQRGVERLPTAQSAQWVRGRQGHELPRRSRHGPDEHALPPVPRCRHEPGNGTITANWAER